MSSRRDSSIPSFRGGRRNDYRDNGREEAPDGGRFRRRKRRGRGGNRSGGRDSGRFIAASGGRREPAAPRPRWTPPALPAVPVPVPECSWCGKPIHALAAALGDRETGLPVHFECVLARLAESEVLEEGDAVCYIGGGRFAVVHFNESERRDMERRMERRGRTRRDMTRDGGGRQIFFIKKIMEWEKRDERLGWRLLVRDYYSLT